MTDISRSLTRLEVLVLVLAAAILTFQLLVPPVVGLADDGDFAKIMGPVGLHYRTERSDLRYYGFLTSLYGVESPWWHSGYATSETLLVLVARFGATGLARSGVLDIRVLGGIHALIFLGGLALLLVGSRPLRPLSKLLFAVLLLLVFTDVGYVALCNSLYSATASFLFLFLLAGVALCLASGLASPTLSAAYWVAALLFVTSKPQESIQAPILGLLAILLARERRGPGPLRRVTWLAAALCVAGGIYVLRTPLYLKAEALYKDVFFQLLLKSPDPRADLEELGAPVSWVAYRGTYAYVPNTPLKDPAFRQEFLKRIGYRRLFAFYVRHPDRAAKMLETAARRAFTLRQHYLGNFPAEAGRSPRELTRAFGLWSALKKKLGPSGPWLLPVFWLANLAGALRTLRRSPDAQPRCLALAVAALVTMSVIELFTCTFADALADVARHLHSFNAMTDLLFAADAAWLASLATRRLAPARAAAATGG